MSLYTIGVFFFKESMLNELNHLQKTLQDTELIVFDNIDEMDKEIVVEQVSRLLPNQAGESKLFFRIASSQDSVDATVLWNEAQASRSKFGTEKIKSRLERVFDFLVSVQSVSLGGVAFFDGSIDSMFVSDRLNCQKYFNRLILNYWDDMENPLIVWK